MASVLHHYKCLRNPVKTKEREHKRTKMIYKNKMLFSVSVYLQEHLRHMEFLLFLFF